MVLRGSRSPDGDYQMEWNATLHQYMPHMSRSRSSTSLRLPLHGAPPQTKKLRCLSVSVIPSSQSLLEEI